MRAKELITTEVCRSWMDAAERATPSSWRQPQKEWLFVPMANPSGRDLVSGVLKERLTTGRESETLCYRGNTRGVDLNRNWPTLEELREATQRAAKRLVEDGPRA